MTTTRAGRFRFGFHVNTPAGYSPGGVDWEATFRFYVDLARYGEALGFDSVWSRQRHFQNDYISSPLVFFAALGQRVERINFGTALLVLRYEDPIRLGEDLSTLDLLAPGRLEVVYSNTRTHPNDVNDAAFRLTTDQLESRLGDNIDRLRSYLAGEPVWTGAAHSRQSRGRSELLLEPRSDRLLSKLWYGSGSVASAVHAASKGLDLFVSTVGPGDVEATQVQQIAAYRQHLGDHPRPHAPRIGVGRYVLPVVDPGDRERYERFVDWFVNEFAALGAAPILLGTPAEIVEQIEASAVTSQADILLVYLPYGFTHQETRKLLRNISEHVFPLLGGVAIDAELTSPATASRDVA